MTPEHGVKRLDLEPMGRLRASGSDITVYVLGENS